MPTSLSSGKRAAKYIWKEAQTLSNASASLLLSVPGVKINPSRSVGVAKDQLDGAFGEPIPYPTRALTPGTEVKTSARAGRLQGKKVHIREESSASDVKQSSQRRAAGILSDPS